MSRLSEQSSMQRTPCFRIYRAQKAAFATPRAVSGTVYPRAIPTCLLVQQKACSMIPRHELPKNQKITEA